MLLTPLVSVVLCAGSALFPATALKPALAEARDGDRLVVAEFWTFGAEPSRSYRTKELSRPEVLAFLENHAVGARVNADFNPSLKKRYFVKELPTVLLLDGNAVLWGRVTGAVPAPKLVERLEDARKERAAFFAARRTLEQSPGDAAALLAIFKGYLRREEADKAEEALTNLRRADPEAETARPEELAFAIAAEILEPRRDLANAVRLYAQAADWARSGNREIRSAALFHVANLKLAAGEPQVTAEVLRLLLEEFPRFPDRSKALYVLGLTYVRELKQPDKGEPYLKEARDSYSDRFSEAAATLLENLALYKK